MKPAGSMLTVICGLRGWELMICLPKGCQDSDRKHSGSAGTSREAFSDCFQDFMS
ncbi:unnamed protein product, partial [Rangifer tarandus platyrhynchus]